MNSQTYNGLPAVGTGVATLIAVSQGGYLAYKAAPHSLPKNAPN